MLPWQEHSNVADAEVGRFVFDDLAAANEASSSSITDVRQLGKRVFLKLERKSPSNKVSVTVCHSVSRCVEHSTHACCMYAGL